MEYRVKIVIDGNFSKVETLNAVSSDDASKRALARVIDELVIDRPDGKVTIEVVSVSVIDKG